MTSRKSLEDRHSRICRYRNHRTASMMLLLPLIVICFSGGAVDAGRLGHSLVHPRRLQSKAVDTEHESSGYQTGSERDISDEDDTPGSSESERFDGLHYSDPISASSEAVHGPDSIKETSKETGKIDQIKEEQEKSPNPSIVTDQKGNNDIDDSGSSDHSFESSSLNENTFTELEVEDITTIVREGASPIEAFQASRGMVFCILLGVCATIFTAWQVADSPDGAYASLCRWTVSTLALLFRILLFPFSMCCNLKNHEHVPLARSDYGYKDPLLEFS